MTKDKKYYVYVNTTVYVSDNLNSYNVSGVLMVKQDRGIKDSLMELLRDTNITPTSITINYVSEISRGLYNILKDSGDFNTVKI